MDLTLTEILLYAGALLATGVAAGFIAGLLGVGGGIVIVPVLFLAFTALGIPDEVKMHVAVGTSLSTIVFTSFASFRAHSRRGAVDFDLLRSWAPGIFAGVVIGTLLASSVLGHGAHRHLRHHRADRCGLHGVLEARLAASSRACRPASSSTPSPP